MFFVLCLGRMRVSVMSFVFEVLFVEEKFWNILVSIVLRKFGLEGILFFVFLRMVSFGYVKLKNVIKNVKIKLKILKVVL